MADVRQLLTGLGYERPQSLLQSGNFVFDGAIGSAARIETTIEAELRRCCGFEADVLVRSADEWRQVVARNPFAREADRDPSHLLVLFLKTPATVARVKTLQAAIVGREVVRADGRQAYIVYPDGIGRSKLTHALIEQRLGIRGTARNWNTVLKL